MLAALMTHQNHTILLTRPVAAARAFTEQLGDLACETLISPVQAIEPVDFEIPTNMQAAIFTSRNGVDAVEGRPIKCWCVGKATMQAAKRKGWLAQSADGDAEALLKRVLADCPSGLLVHFRGHFARGNLVERLCNEGLCAQDVIAYKQVSQPLNAQAKTALNGANQIILPIFSPRSAKQLVQQGPFSATIHVVAMSNAVASEAAALSPKQLVISTEPNATSMIAAIKQVANGL